MAFVSFCLLSWDWLLVLKDVLRNLCVHCQKHNAGQFVVVYFGNLLEFLAQVLLEGQSNIQIWQTNEGVYLQHQYERGYQLPNALAQLKRLALLGLIGN